jgi:acyl-CoA hydrolase
MRNYREEYRSKLVTADKAAQTVKSDSFVDYGHFVLKPIEFDIALSARVGELSNVQIRACGGVPPVPAVVAKDPEQKSFRYLSTFCTELDRRLSEKGLGSYTPANYHTGNDIFSNPQYRSIWPDVFCTQATPMDAHGYFNIGIGNSYSKSMVRGARVVIIEENNTIPRCLGGYEESIHISEVDHIVEGKNSPIITLPPSPEPDEAETRIAELIMEEITDGACLQLGIGALPNRIGNLIADSDLKDLGITTEMFCDAMVKLHETGKITNARKTVDKYKSVYTFALGTKETYDFMDNNPGLASCNVEYCNDPAHIRLNDKVISINNILEIDLFTQICSESRGPKQISGTGGQVDFVFGATESKGGRSFLAFTSTFTDKTGKLHSRVRPLLTPGAIVTVPRAAIQYVVTEYGKACLRGRSIWDRAEMITGLAHPNFREQLIKKAEALGIWCKSNKIA